MAIATNQSLTSVEERAVKWQKDPVRWVSEYAMQDPRALKAALHSLGWPKCRRYYCLTLKKVKQWIQEDTTWLRQVLSSLTKTDDT